MPEIIVGTCRAAKSMGDISKAEVREALQRLDPLWNELFPTEPARIVQLLLERVDDGPNGPQRTGLPPRAIPMRIESHIVGAVVLQGIASRFYLIRCHRFE